MDGRRERRSSVFIAPRKSRESSPWFPLDSPQVSVCCDDGNGEVVCWSWSDEKDV